MKPPDTQAKRTDLANLEQSLFEQASSLAPGERRAFLLSSCSGDASMLERVEALLRANDGSGDFMATPASGDLRAGESAAGANSRASSLEGTSGERIGRYRIIEQIGEGGFGIVYLAEQEEPVRRRVALKIIKVGMDTREVIARFESERQALALMDHPNIATVFDGGATESGRPYFVMEMVSGVPITSFCDEQRLTIRERLGLFIQVCGAVQHAHQKGVIHRDLKPSNILIAQQDPGSPGCPKVIDFGIAKATEQRLTDQTAFTRLHAFVGTPAYMSPEQTLANGADVDTRSDIYSLGVLLYELLAGCAPLDTKALQSADFAEIIRTIRETEPRAPSQCIESSEVQLQTKVSDARATESAKLAKFLRGDLDRIALKCLEKERARRYETANGLAMDLQRHLNNEPVLARPATIRYRAGRFVRRHRVPVVAAVALVLALAGGLAGTITQTRRAMRATARAAEEAASSHAVSDFLQNDLLARANPENEPDRELKLRTVLDRAAERIEGRFENQPMVEADLRETLAATYLSLGEYAGAGIHWERAHALRAQRLGPEDSKTLHAAANLAVALKLQGKFAEAEILAKDTLETRRRLLGTEAPETLVSLGDLGSIYSKQGKLAETEEVYAEVLAIRRRVSGPDHSDTITAMNNLAGALLHREKNVEGEQLRLEVLESATRVLGPEHPNTLMAMHNVAHMYMNFGNTTEAERFSTQALALCKRVLGPEHPNTLISLSTLARIYGSLGRFADAKQMQSEILEIQKRTLGPDHPDVVITMHNLTMRHRDAGDLEDAEALCIQALEKFSKVFGPEHRFTLNSMGKLAGIYCDREKFEEAIELATRTVAICERVLPDAHLYTVQARHYLGAGLLERNRLDEGETQLRLSLAGLTARKDSWEAASITGKLGRLLFLQKRFEDAEPLLLEAHKVMTKHEAKSPPIDRAELGTAARTLAQMYRDWSRPEDAEKWEAAIVAATSSQE
jgi:serine/threonine protein kinase